MQMATLRHQLTPGQDPNVSELGPNLKFATLESSKAFKPVRAMIEYSLARSASLGSQLVFLSWSTSYPPCSDKFNPSNLPDSYCRSADPPPRP